MGIDVGDPLPLFKAYDQQGVLRKSTDFLGRLIVLFFYLKDNTPICSREACDFRDAINELQARGILVIGVSPDSVLSHRQFAQSNRLNYLLLSDEQLQFAKAMGVVRPDSSIDRSTFIIDKKGTVQWVERSVQIEEHISRLLTVVDSLESS